jgi:hypothetical protein
VSVFEIPTPSQDEPFASQRTVLDGREYVLRFSWNDREDRWYLEIADEADSPIASGIKIVPNIALARRVRDERMPPGWILALSEDDTPPLLGELGGRVKLYYYDAAEILLGNTAPVSVPEYVPSEADLMYLTVDGLLLTVDGMYLYV